MEDISQTIYANYIQTCKQFNAGFELYANTTLNEKLDILSGVAPTSSEMPFVGFWAIGNGGHKISFGADQIGFTEPKQHSATDAALFNQLPFVLRTLDNDLTPAQRANYALRRVETHDGVRYYAYYLRRFDVTNIKPVMQIKVVEDGITTVSAFVPSTANLSPTEATLVTDVANLASAQYANVSAQFTISLTEDEIADLLNVASVIYGNETLAIISEIAICSGVDKIVSTTSNGNTINFKEAIAVQVNNYANVFQELKYSKKALNIAMNIGVSEPLYKVTTA